MIKKFFLALMLVTFTMVGLVLPTSNAYAQSAPVQQRIRYSVSTPQGQKNIQSLETAMAIMRTLSCKSPQSWFYQGAIHWMPGIHSVDQHGKYIFEDNKVCPEYSLKFLKTSANQLALPEDQFKARKELEKLLLAWQHCTHDLVDFNLILRDREQNKVTGNHFLAWHRIELEKFEKIVRTLSGDPDFTLPYWDYTDKNSLDTPAGFTDHDPNRSLYTPLRRSNINEPYTFNDEVKKPGVEIIQQIKIRKGKTKAYKSVFFNANSAPKINNPKLARLFLSEGFNHDIENSPHNLQHVYIGGFSDTTPSLKTAPNPVWNNQASPIEGGLLADVRTAGFEPIFWIHHAAVDYYWDSWLKVTGIKLQPQDLPLPDYVKPLYIFADENGNEVRYNSSEEIIAAVSNPGYTYDKIDPDAQKYAPTPDKVESYRNKAKAEADLINVLSNTPGALNFDQFVIGSKKGLTQTILPESKKPIKPTLITLPVVDDGTNVPLQRLDRYSLNIQVSFKPQEGKEKPTETYSVYLKSPQDNDIEKIAQNLNDYYVGSLVFFAPRNEQGKWELDIDVTDEVKRVLKEQECETEKAIDIVFVPDVKEPNDNIFVTDLKVYHL